MSEVSERPDHTHTVVVNMRVQVNFRANLGGPQQSIEAIRQALLEEFDGIVLPIDNDFSTSPGSSYELTVEVVETVPRVPQQASKSAAS